MQFANNFGQPIGTTQAYVPNNPMPIPTQIYAPVENQSLGIDFTKLIDTNVSIPGSPIVPQNGIVTQTTPPKKRGRKKKNADGEEPSKETDSKAIVENTVYADTYYETNNMAYDIIRQTDELLGECKQELEHLRAQRALKGKYHYINDTVSSMGTLLSAKLAAIKEINSTIKTVNDNEYRRFKDFKAMNAMDDNKAVLDAYTAFISAPMGMPEYKLPGTANLTGGMNGIVQSPYPVPVQNSMDQGMAHYLSNLSPEENLMLHDNNKELEEVIVYDQATGAKYFQWINTRTGDIIPNMPISSELTIEDFTIDPRTKLAKNTNLNCIKKVVVLNEGAFDKF